MGCLAKVSSTVLILVSSIFYLSIGLAVVAASIAAMVTVANLLIPTWYSGIALAIGVVIVILAIAGFMGACRKEKKCWLGIFLIFTLLIFIFVVIVCVLMFMTNQAIKLAEENNFVDVDGMQKTATDSMYAAVEETWNKCEAEVTKEGSSYTLNCQKDGFDLVEDIVNEGCLNKEVDQASFNQCYTESEVASGSGSSMPLNSPKGVFCQCKGELTDFVTQYFTVGQWVAVGIAVFYLFVFVACCYLCCCSSEKKKKNESGIMMRP